MRYFWKFLIAMLILNGNIYPARAWLSIAN